MLACNKGQVKAIITLVREKQGATSEQIKDWVNKRTDTDQFTPLHLASFKGNMDAVEVLIEHGSDPMAINAYGLSMLHTAAQGDVANSLYYFK